MTENVTIMPKGLGSFTIIIIIIIVIIIITLFSCWKSELTDKMKCSFF